MQTTATNNDFGLLQLAIIAITAIVSFVIGILLTPIRKWISSEHDELCSFVVHNSPFKELHQIKVKKRFNKTVYINCTLFNRQEKKTLNNSDYLFCNFGTSPKNVPYNYVGGYCPFDTTSQKIFKK